MSEACTCRFGKDLQSYLDEAFRQQNDSLNAYLAETLRRELWWRPTAFASAADALARADGGCGGCITAAPPRAYRNVVESRRRGPEAAPRPAAAVASNQTLRNVSDSAVEPCLSDALGESPKDGVLGLAKPPMRPSVANQTCARVKDFKPRRSSLTPKMSKVSRKTLERRTRMSCHPKEEEPLTRMRTFFQAVFATEGFDICMLLVVGLYTVSLGVQAEYSMMPDNKHINEVLFWPEVCFCAIFSFELSAKIFVDGRQFFHKAWNIWMFTLVPLQLLELVLMSMSNKASQEGHADNDIIFRVLRFLRIARVFRYLRVFTIHWEIRTIVVSVLGSMRHVVWMFILIVSSACVPAIFITFMVGDMYERCDGEPPTHGGQACPEVVQKLFGSVSASTFTLFAAVSGGVDWQEAALLLRNKVNVVACVLLVLYVILVFFVVANAMMGVIVDSALRSSEEAQMETLKTMAQQAFQKAAGREIIDRDTDATQIDRAAFVKAMNGNEMKRFFLTLNIDIDDSEKIFDLLDVDMSGSIDFRQFLESIPRMSGPAKALDFAAFQRLFQTLHSKSMDEIADLRQIVDELYSSCSFRGDMHSVTLELDDAVLHTREMYLPRCSATKHSGQVAKPGADKEEPRATRS